MVRQQFYRSSTSYSAMLAFLCVLVFTCSNCRDQESDPKPQKHGNPSAVSKEMAIRKANTVVSALWPGIVAKAPSKVHEESAVWILTYESLPWSSVENWAVPTNASSAVLFETEVLIHRSVTKIEVRRANGSGTELGVSAGSK